MIAAVFVVVGLLLLGIAIERVNAMQPGTRLRWLKAPLWWLVGMLGLGLLLTPAKAETLRYKTSDGASIELTADKGPCAGEARLAHYTSADLKTKVQGCYRLRNGSVVTLSWLDGDHDMVPARQFKSVDAL